MYTRPRSFASIYLGAYISFLMFRRKSSVSGQKKKDKKRLAQAKKLQKEEEKNSPVQLVSVVKRAADDDNGGEETTKPTEMHKLVRTPNTTPTGSASHPPQDQPSARGPSTNLRALKAQSSVHVIRKDSVTSTASFDLGGEHLECDYETVQLTFDDKREDEFELVPTNHPNMQIMRNRLESAPSPRINRSYEL